MLAAKAPVAKHANSPGVFRLRLSFLAFPLMLFSAPAVAQPDPSVEDLVSREMEAQRAERVGDCSRVSLSWFQMRWGDADNDWVASDKACRDAQFYALRHGESFERVLPVVAREEGGTRSVTCQPQWDATARSYSGCHLPEPPPVPSGQDKWSLARAREVAKDGPAATAALTACGVMKATQPFAFDINAAGRVTHFSDAGYWGRAGPGPDEKPEYDRIERLLKACPSWPRRLWKRYIHIDVEAGAMKVEQVRPE